MFQKILKRITNNFGLKILAAVIAIVFWLIIVKVEDPEKTITFTVQAEMISPEYLEEQGLTYEVLDDSDYITFAVTGQRSIVTRLNASDFVVTADLSNIENNSQVPITISAKRYGNQISITKRVQYVEVFVENIVTEKISVEVESVGDTAEGFQVSDLQANIKEVTVTGPESVVKTIDRAVAWVEVGSMQADSVTRTELVLYDAENNIINTSRLTMDHKTVSVFIGIMEQKEVPVEYEVNGTPAAGYQLVSVTGDVDTVIIVGKSQDIGQVEKILISGSEMDISGITRTMEKKIRIADYLPEGVTLGEDQPKEANVTVSLESEGVRTFEIPTENIQIQNIPVGYSVTPDQDVVTVSLKGYPSDLSDISERSLQGTADASGLTEGSHTITVKISGNYRQDGTVQMSVTVKKQEPDQPAEEPDSGA